MFNIIAFGCSVPVGRNVNYNDPKKCTFFDFFSVSVELCSIRRIFCLSREKIRLILTYFFSLQFGYPIAMYTHSLYSFFVVTFHRSVVLCSFTKLRLSSLLHFYCIAELCISVHTKKLFPFRIEDFCIALCFLETLRKLHINVSF